VRMSSRGRASPNFHSCERPILDKLLPVEDGDDVETTQGNDEDELDDACGDGVLENRQNGT
jgi:hypothetical protein